MNLKDLTPALTAKTVSKQIKTQFGANYNVEKLGLSESVKLLNKTNNMIVEFKHTSNLHESENNASYMKLIMVNEAAYKRAEELTEAPNLQGTEMNNTYVKALKIAALGGQLSEAQLKALQVSQPMQQVLESQESAQRFMKKIVENKKAKRALKESEIATAQTTLAAQDIADQIQTMIEKFADVRYKELPALQDSIRSSQGVEAAESFNSVVLASLEGLTSALESSKTDINNAVSSLTGEEMPMGDGDLDLDAVEGGDEMNMDDELDLGMGDMGMDDEMGMDDMGGEDDFAMDLEADDETVDLGRARR